MLDLYINHIYTPDLPVGRTLYCLCHLLFVSPCGTETGAGDFFSPDAGLKSHGCSGIVPGIVAHGTPELKDTKDVVLLAHSFTVELKK